MMAFKHSSHLLKRADKLLLSSSENRNSFWLSNPENICLPTSTERADDLPPSNLLHPYFTSP